MSGPPEDKREDKRKEAFILMPFDSSLDDIYYIGIQEVFEKRGYLCTRVDERPFSGQIIREVHRRIRESDVIVAEMTDKNANVYYEVGYAHGLGKQPILITAEAKTLPFDLSGYKHIEYRGKIQTLRAELGKYLDWLEGASSAIRKITRNPEHLRAESKTVLIYLHKAGEDRSAAECAERAKGLFSVLNDLRFLGYVAFYGSLIPSTPIHLTEVGAAAAKKLVQQAANP